MGLRKTLLALSVLACTVASCTKENDAQEVGGKTVRKIREENQKRDEGFQFSYNKNRQLMGMSKKSQHWGVAGLYNDFEDGQFSQYRYKGKKLAELKHWADGSHGGTNRRMVFEYDGDHLSHITYGYAGFMTVDLDTVHYSNFKYDGDNVISFERRRVHYGHHSETRYHYEEGNLVTVSITDLLNHQTKNYYLSYDEFTNPFHGTFRGGPLSARHLSVNNIVRISDDSGETIFRREYEYKRGRPVKELIGDSVYCFIYSL